MAGAEWGGGNNMIYKTKPNNFKSDINVVGCYILNESKFLLLQRNQDKTHGGQWGLPAGKIEPDETKHQAMIRELNEETGIEISESGLNLVETLFINNNGYHIVFTIFKVKLLLIPNVVLEKNEHQNYKWVTAVESMKMDYVHDLDGCNKIMFGKI